MQPSYRACDIKSGGYKTERKACVHGNFDRVGDASIGCEGTHKGNSMDKSAEAHAFALGETAGSSLWLEGHVCLSFLHSTYYKLLKGRFYGASTFPEYIQ